MTGECSRFNDLLMDLAYDELGEADAAEMRAHAVGCPDCREALESILLTRRLAARIPAAEAPAGWEAAVLELAAEAAVDHARISAADRESDTSFDRSIGFVERRPGFFDRMRTLLLRPALVTAAAASVVFAVSFFLYRNAGTAFQDGAVEHPGAPFVGPAVALEERAGAAAEREPTGQPAQPVAIAVATDLDRPTSPSRAEAGTRMPQANKGGLGTAGPAPRNSADKLDAESSGGGKTLASGDFASAPPPAPFQSAAAEEERAAAEPEPAGATGGGWPMAAPTPAMKQAGQGYTLDDADHYRDGMNAYDRGDCAAASAALQRVLDPPVDAPDLVPSSLHHLGRCEKRSGRCAKALLFYENLISSHPAYPARADALWEAAACHRKLGHVERASALLDELADVPGWRAKAAAEKGSMGPSKADD